MIAEMECGRHLVTVTAAESRAPSAGGWWLTCRDPRCRACRGGVSTGFRTISALREVDPYPPVTPLYSLPLNLGMSPGHSGVWVEALAAYAIALRAAGRAIGTIRLHRHYLDRLARCCPHPWDVTTADLRAVLAAHTWKPETRKSARSVFRSFYRWAHGEGLVDADPALRLEPVRVPPGVPRPTPERLVELAIATAPPREELMLRLGAYGGLRCCEIAVVHSGDYDHDAARLLVHGKGGKTRSVPIVEPNLSVMLAGVHGYAFPNRWTGEPITAGHVSKLLSRALDAGWTAHTLRHRMGTRALAKTKDLLAVGKVLGHARPETTQRYCEVEDDRLIAAVAAAAA